MGLMYMYMTLIIHEIRKKDKATQHNSPKAVIFLRKAQLAGLKSHIHVKYKATKAPQTKHHKPETYTSRFILDLSCASSPSILNTLEVPLTHCSYGLQIPFQVYVQVQHSL